MNLPPSIFAAFCKQIGVGAPEQEYRFHETRKWRFDYAWPKQKVALEVDGGIWIRGRHTRGSGQVKDMEKFNTAARLGWRVLKVQPKELMTMATAELLKETINP